MPNDGLDMPKGWHYPTTMSQFKIAEAFGVSRQAFARWVTAGCPKSKDGTFDLRAVIRWYVERERDIVRAELGSRDRGEDGPTNEGKPSDRKEDAAATLLEIKVAAELGRFVDREATETAWGRAVTLFTSQLQSVPARVAKRLEGKSAIEIANVLSEEMRNAVREMDEAFQAGMSGDDEQEESEDA